jgi:hypothetical protein
MFASLRNKFSIDLDIEKEHHYRRFRSLSFDIVAFTRTYGIAVGHFINGRTVTGRFEPLTSCSSTSA